MAAKDLQERIDTVTKSVAGFSTARRSVQNGIKASLTKLENDLADATEDQRDAVAALRELVGARPQTSSRDDTPEEFAARLLAKDTTTMTKGKKAAHKAWLRMAESGVGPDTVEALRAAYRAV